MRGRVTSSWISCVCLIFSFSSPHLESVPPSEHFRELHSLVAAADSVTATPAEAQPLDSILRAISAKEISLFPFVIGVSSPSERNFSSEQK